MKLSPIIFLSLLIFTRIAKNHTSTEDFSRILFPVNDEEEEEEEGEEEGAGISEHQPEASDGDNDEIKLHNSLQSLREYLEMLNKNKNHEEEPTSTEEPLEDNGLGPHYHTMYTNEPPGEMLPKELQDDVNVGDNPPKDLFFQPIPISDKTNMAERNMEVGTGGKQQIRETILLAVSSATLAVLLLLTVFCAMAIYYCTKPYRYLDDFSLTSSEKRALCYPSDYSLTATEDSSCVFNHRLLTIQSSSETKHARRLSTSSYVDEISTFSDESARTTERDKSEAEQSELAPCQAAPSSEPPSAEAAPPSVPLLAEGAASPPAEGEPPPAAEGAPPPAAEGAPPEPPPAEGAPPEPPPAEGAPPEPPPAEGAPPEPPPAEGAPLLSEEAPPPAQ